MFKVYKFKNSSAEYQILTDKNKAVLAEYMKSNNLDKLIITADDNGEGWNHSYLPNLDDFGFIDELLIYWTNVKDISEVHKCKSIRTLWLDNDDKTEINFASFSKLEKVITWNRKGVKNIWNVTTLKSLTVAGFKSGDFRNELNLRFLDKLRILKSPIVDLSFLAGCENLTFLELRSMNNLINLEVLGKLVKLRHLRIEANKTKSFSFLANLSDLESLYLKSKNGFLQINQLKGIKSIKKFNFSGNNNMLQVTRDYKSKIRSNL